MPPLISAVCALVLFAAHTRRPSHLPSGRPGPPLRRCDKPRRPHRSSRRIHRTRHVSTQHTSAPRGAHPATTLKPSLTPHSPPLPRSISVVASLSSGVSCCSPSPSYPTSSISAPLVDTSRQTNTTMQSSQVRHSPMHLSVSTETQPTEHCMASGRYGGGRVGVGRRGWRVSE